MPEQDNLAVIRAWVDAIDRNDVDAELACWQPDGEYRVIPTGTVYRGLAQISQAGRQLATMVAGQPIKGRKQITHLEGGEQWACVSYDTHATIRGPIVLDGVTVVPEGSERAVLGRRTWCSK